MISDINRDKFINKKSRYLATSLFQLH